MNYNCIMCLYYLKVFIHFSIFVFLIHLFLVFFVAKLIVMFLHSSYFNVDEAYKTITNYCKYRKELPQVFENYDPSSEEMKQVFDNM